MEMYVIPYYSTLAHNAYDWGRQIPMRYGIYAIPVLSHFVTCCESVTPPQSVTKERTTDHNN